jgi:hypothetical protein
MRANYILLKKMKNDHIRNLVGHLDENEQQILNYLKPNNEFIITFHK